jgi:hypothetical protein
MLLFFNVTLKGEPIFDAKAEEDKEEPECEE